MPLYIICRVSDTKKYLGYFFLRGKTILFFFALNQHFSQTHLPQPPSKTMITSLLGFANTENIFRINTFGVDNQDHRELT